MTQPETLTALSDPDNLRFTIVDEEDVAPNEDEMRRLMNTPLRDLVGTTQSPDGEVVVE